MIGCANNIQLKPNQIIRTSDCDENISVIMKNEYREREELFCLSDKPKLQNLHHNGYLAYVGSNDKFHFFYWYVKRKYYEEQPTGFALHISEYVPKNKFDIQETKIGEHPFPY